MPLNLIFIDESESMQRAVAAIFQNNPEFNLNLLKDPSSLYKTAKTFIPDIIVLSYNTIDTEIKKSITEIKTGKEFSNIPLVLLVPSDLSDNERETLIKLKSDGFIYRPFDKDSFISKIKRTLNISNAVPHIEEKIYDISSFENKKTEVAPDSSYSAENAAGGSDVENNKEADNSAFEPSELSQAFENLFKDDAIFKEFQDLNKKDGEEDSVYIIDEEHSSMPEEPVEILHTESTAAAGSNETSQEILYETMLHEDKPANAPEAIPEIVLTPSQTTIEHDKAAEVFDFGMQAEQSEPASPLIPSEPAESESHNSPEIYDFGMQAEPLEILGTSPVKAAEVFDFGMQAAEPLESAVSFDSIAVNEAEPQQIEHTEYNKGAFALNESFAGDGLNIKKLEGESNLKILDEQNLVKLEDYLKNAIEKTIEEIKPQILETIKTSLPEIVERLVKEEIEKIKQQQ